MSCDEKFVVYTPMNDRAEFKCDAVGLHISHSFSGEIIDEIGGVAYYVVMKWTKYKLQKPEPEKKGPP